MYVDEDVAVLGHDGIWHAVRYYDGTTVCGMGRSPVHGLEYRDDKAVGCLMCIDKLTSAVSVREGSR